MIFWITGVMILSSLFRYVSSSRQFHVCLGDEKVELFLSVQRLLRETISETMQCLNSV